MKKFVRSQTLARMKRLDAQLQRAARKPEDPKAIHDVRVAIRRLAQCLEAFEAWFDPAAVRKMRKRLRKLMTRCGAVRNCDIAVEVLRAAGWTEGEPIPELERRRLRAQIKLSSRLRSWRRRGTAASWREHLRVEPRKGGPGLAPAGAPAHAQRVLPAMAEDFFRAGGNAADPAAGHRKMHRFRLMAKRFRYTMELFAPLYGTRSKLVIDSLRGLQDKLGAINDCATTAVLVAKNSRATAKVRRLARRRVAEFRRYWSDGFGVREKIRWKSLLAGKLGEE